MLGTRPINRWRWIWCTGALLGGHALLSLFVGAFYEEIEIGPLHLGHLLLAIGIALLLPGLPFSRLYYLHQQRETSLARVLGLAFVFNACFFVVLTRALALLRVAPSSMVIFSSVAVCTAAGVALLFLRARRSAHGWIKKRDHFNLFVGSCLTLCFVIFQAADLSRPSQGYLPHPEWQTTSQPQPVSHTFRSGFRKLKDNEWSLVDRVGTIELSTSRPSATFPLRLVLSGVAGATVVLETGGRILHRHRHEMYKDDKPSNLFVPRHQSSMLAFDVPLGNDRTILRLRVDGPNRRPLRVVDYSNLGDGRTVETLSRSYRFTGALMVTEMFRHTDDSIREKHLFAILPDMPVGYLMLGIVQLLGGHGLLVLNLFSVAVSLLCFLLACDLIQAQLSARHRLSVILPAIVTSSTLLKLLSFGEYYLFLPDLIFTAFLLIALRLAPAGRLLPGATRAETPSGAGWRHQMAGYLMSSVVCALTRLSGLPLLVFDHLIRLLVGPARKQTLWRFGLTSAFWVVIFAGVLLQAFPGEGLVGACLKIYCTVFFMRQPVTRFSMGERLVRFASALFRSTAGLVVFLFLPFHSLGWRLGLLVLVYSVFLFDHYQVTTYHLVPLALLCSVAVAANILAKDRNWPYLLAPAVILGVCHVFLPADTYRSGVGGAEEMLYRTGHFCGPP